MPVVMDADRMGRTLTRIAHEIRRAQSRPRRARPGRHPDRAVCRWPGGWPAIITTSTSHDVPTGALDITLYRDDLMRHAVGAQPVDPPHRDPLLDRRQAHPAGRRCALHRPDDSGGARRADRVRPAEVDPAGRARRPRPPRAADQGRLRRQEPADLADAERPGAPARNRRPRRSGDPGMKKDLLGIDDLSRDEIYRDPRHRRRDARDRRAADQESADAARQDGRQPVLRTEHAHPDLVRDRREAPERRHAEHRGGLVERARRARRWPTPR